MAKPKKPLAPREPIKPTKVYLESCPMRIPMHAETTLAAILKEIHVYGNRVLGNRRATGLPAFDEIKTVCGDWELGSVLDLAWDQEIEVTLSDEEYAGALKAYEEAVAQYPIRREEHKVAWFAYEKAHMVYKEKQDRHKVKMELRELERLKAKHPNA